MPAGPDVLTALTGLDPEALAREAVGAGGPRLEHGRASRGGPPERGASSAAATRAAARTLLDGVVTTQRLINHLQAVQQRWLTAFCQPGVAVPLDDLVDLAGTDLTDALAAAVDASDSAAATAAGNPDSAAAASTCTAFTCTAGCPTGGGRREPAALLAHPAHGPVLREAALRVAAAEIGCALHLAPITARMRCESACEMVTSLPSVHAAQRAGDLDSYRARLIADRTRALPIGLRHRVATRVLALANVRTAAAVRRLVDREVIEADPAAARERCEQARQGRDVYSTHGDDGMSVFKAVVPAADSELAADLFDHLATALVAGGAAGGRTRAQLRADAFTDLVRTLTDTGRVHLAAVCPRSPDHNFSDTGDSAADTTGTGRGEPLAIETGCHATGPAPGRTASTVVSRVVGSGGRNVRTVRSSAAVAAGRRVALNVYLDATTLAGFDDKPGEVAGYGAITAADARALAASATTIRTILARPAHVTATAAASGRGHPSPRTNSQRACGTILDAGRAVYRPPEAIADYVAARDRTCCFPGCRTPASRCDLDHRTPFHAGGETCPCNLDALCRTHHRLKTFTRWRATRRTETDRITWTSPLGIPYLAEPAHLLHDAPIADDDPPPF